jgi:hypothetical protein
MGVMGRLIGGVGAARSVGAAVADVAEVFVGNRAARDAAEHAEFAAVVEQYGDEFVRPDGSRFDAFVNGLNRLPRPLMVMGTLGLFVYAMAAPAGFSLRMEGLALVPEPLWWLLGAIVSFYFGARELHYRREIAPPAAARPGRRGGGRVRPAAARPPGARARGPGRPRLQRGDRGMAPPARLRPGRGRARPRDLSADHGEAICASPRLTA